MKNLIYKNSVILKGILQNDIKLQETTQKTIYTTNFIKTVNTQGKESFTPIKAWGEVAKTLANNFKKGSVIEIKGRCHWSYKKLENGQYKNYAFIVVNEIVFSNQTPQEEIENDNQEFDWDFLKNF